ncbi:alpha/beta hydrolase [Sporosarcina sp. E16_3]|uniref:alpha/beta fold hydrolase n=1 Tax=Sporosarcina sp. E16_3 TaxID=2789293 RepID=UPI001A9248BE|nr:alpha/beta hydrolase [Sporosarcina sp. E16_3]MBO0603093.1 alpha/beta hydrolase [Sporosarcina sp. E16_3]
MRKMKRIFKIIVLSIIILFVVIISGSWVYHSTVLKKEIASTPAPGVLVDVDGHQIHVYTEGDGVQTIVFLSGAGTSAPTLDFKPLWSELSPTYTIAVVEKAGYGWSDTADVSREIDIVLEENRTALQLAGVQPPYVLAAHSMSGLEAIRWTQKYPEEVEAIIGLDPAIPAIYEVLPLPSLPSILAATAFARTGMIRLVPFIVNSSSAIESGYLTAEDITMYRSLFYRRTLTSNMLEEVKQVQANAEKVDQAEIPFEVPMYFFISDGNEIGIPNWREMLSDYIGQLDRGQFLYLNVGHYVHVWEPELIANEIETFLMR